MKYSTLNTMSDKTENDIRRSGWTVGMLAIPMLLCCGLPTIVAILATASVLIKGVLAGVVVVAIGTVFASLIRRHIRQQSDCCVSPIHEMPSSE